MKTMKLKLLLLCSCSILSNTYSQNNKHIEFSPTKINIQNQSINSIIILNDEVQYNKTLAVMKNDHYDNLPFSYVDSVNLDFIKISTKYYLNDSVFYAVHFNLQKGVELGFCVDTFLIPSNANFVLYTLKSNLIEKYNSNNKPKFYKGINAYYFVRAFMPRQNVIFVLSVPKENEKIDFKIHFNAICVAIADFGRNLTTIEKD